MTAETPLPLRELVDRSRRIGADESLVVHGGGNTSAKGELVDRLGRTRPVMWVKGSGADLKSAGEADYPAVFLDDLLGLATLEQLDDTELVEFVGRAMVDPGARRPSIETLLHALLPFRHVDHVHADAICVLTNHAGGREAVREALGEGFAYVDWLRPGFALSKTVGELAHADGVVLAHHGLVTWADDSGECERRTLSAVAAAVEYLTEQADAPPAPEVPDLDDEQVRSLLLHLRGRLQQRGARVLRVDDRLRAAADRPDADRMVAAGVATADHMLRAKPWSCLVPDPTDLVGATAAVDAYVEMYEGYAKRNEHLLPEGHEFHDPTPSVLLVPGLGGVTTGSDEAEARVRADIAVHTHAVASRVIDTFGEPEPMAEEEVFGFDYWPMELYKLSLKPPPAQLSGRVFVVTGAASGIGRAATLQLAALGASVVAADIDADGLGGLVEEVTAAGGPEPAILSGDQADEEVVAETVRTAVRRFGGLDGAVINAGIGVTSTLEELSAERWRQALEVNLTSAFLLTRESIRVLREQGTGGALVYVASKNAFGPGAGFGAYSVSKAGMVQLMRIAALEGGEHGIRANAVNPDAVFDNSRLWSSELRAERAAAHGVPEDELEDFYAKRNLLGRRVTTDDVTAAVAFLLSDDSSRTTGAVVPVDGGVATAFPR